VKERKKQKSFQNDTEKMKRHNQVVVTRLRTGYSRATHYNKMEGTLDPNFPFCSAKRTLEQILWQRKETEEERCKSSMTKQACEKGEEGAKMMVEYVKNIGLYYKL
jgi:hypothetical protein